MRIYTDYCVSRDLLLLQHFTKCWRKSLIAMAYQWQTWLVTLLTELPTCQVAIGVSTLRSGKHHPILSTSIVMPTCTSDSEQTRMLFGILNSTATFMSFSHKRMDIWREYPQWKCHKVQKIDETRCWSKDRALGKLFGKYDSPVPEQFILLLQTLQKITSCKEFNHKANY